MTPEPTAKRDQSSGGMSLLWRILISTSLAITVLFGAFAWVIQNQFTRLTEVTLEEEVRASFRAYESLWQARADQLASVSLVLSRMPDVRSAFGTGDEATIKDTAREVWDGLSRPDTLFLVADPRGAVIASVADASGASTVAPARLTELPFVANAVKKFPQQVRGFVPLQGRLFQIVLTPVYVAGSQGPALLNVLVAGIAVSDDAAREMKSATGGSDFVFCVPNGVEASTLSPAASQHLAADEASREIRVNDADFFRSVFPLKDLDGNQIGSLSILRSFETARSRIAAMRMRLALLWIASVMIGVWVSYLLTRRLLRPVAELDRAALEIAGGNYGVKVPVAGSGEIARLAESFNQMGASLDKAREELIHQERISVIGRLSASIIHDLRNPLAAIYGGSEMLVDGQLTSQQVQRLSTNIYRASRQVQELLQELSDVTQGRGQPREVCRLREVVQAGYEPLTAKADTQRVIVEIDVADELELPLDRSPMERVFQNLVSNAIEAMPEGGTVSIHAHRDGSNVVVSVEDTGPGVPATISGQLFQPFVTAGKQNGMGLGLALSRKTVQSHGGDLSLASHEGGALFELRLPV